MEINKTLKQAIDKRFQSFLLATATISLPAMRQTQIAAYNDAVNYKADNPDQRPFIEQFKIQTELLIHEAQQHISHIVDQYPILYSWQNYINELKQQVDTLNDILLAPPSTYYTQL